MAHGIGWADYRAVKADLLRYFPTFLRIHDPHNNLRGAYAGYLRYALRTDGEWGDHEHSHMFARRHDCTVVIHRPDDERVYVGEGARQIHFYWQNQNHYDYLIPAGRVAIAPQPAATPPRQSNPRRTAGRASGKVKEQRRNQRKPRAQAPKPPEPTKQNQVAGEKRKGK